MQQRLVPYVGYMTNILHETGAQLTKVMPPNALFKSEPASSHVMSGLTQSVASSHRERLLEVGHRNVPRGS